MRPTWILPSLLFFACVGAGENLTHSRWTVNVSEGDLTSPPRLADDQPEIAIAGRTIHVLWVADDPQLGAQTVLFYRRSRDNGKTWEPRMKLFSDKELVSAYNGQRRLAVDANNVVHVGVANYAYNSDGSWYGQLVYLRSANGGGNWDPPRTILRGALSDYAGFVYCSTDGVKTTFGLRTAGKFSGQSAYQIATTADGGRSFSTATLYSRPGARDGFDLKRAEDRTYVLYADIESLYSGFIQMHVAVARDNGSVVTHLVSAPADDGKHHAAPWQDEDYSPKIAVNGEKAYVVWAGLDARGVRRAFLRRLAGGGATLGPLLAVSPDLPDRAVLASTQVSVAAAGSYAFITYKMTNGRIYLRRYNEETQTLEPAREQTSSGYYLSSGKNPWVATGPAETAFVMWGDPALSYSTDGFTTQSGPILDSPAYSWRFQAGAWRFKMAAAPDGSVHWVATGVLAGYMANGTGTYDPDIFYGQWSPPPAPSVNNQALVLNTYHPAQGAFDARYDTMQVPASEATNFTTAMTASLWVMPQAGGVNTGTTANFQPVLTKRETVFEDSGYTLGTIGPEGARQPLGGVTTTTGTVNAVPPAGRYNLTMDAWVHLAVTYDAGAGPNNLKLYVDGNLAAEATQTGPLALSGGGLFVGGFGNWIVDDLSLWSRALTPDEINRTKAGPLTGTEPGLSLYFNFNGTTRAQNNPAVVGNLLYRESFTSVTPVAQGSASRYTLREFVISRTTPADCTAPAPAESFRPTDQRAVLYFIGEGNAGGVARAEFIAPDNSRVVNSVFDPQPEDGSYCRWTWVDLAGTPNAQRLGRWTVRALWDENEVLSGSFLLENPTAGSTSAIILTSGQPRSFSLPAVTAPTLFGDARLYRIDVPANASRLEIVLTTTTPNADVDLYASAGSAPAVSGGRVVADHASESLSGDERILIDRNSTPPLRAGAYFIALAAYTTGVATQGSLLASIDAPDSANLREAVTSTTAPPRDTCGAPPATDLVRPSNARVYVWFLVDGPRGEFPRVEWLDPAGQTASLSNFAPQPETGSYCYESSMAISGTPAASRFGRWTVRISWGPRVLRELFFTLDNPATPGVGLTAGVPRAWSLEPFASPALMAPATAFRLDVPANATRLEARLETATSGADVDLFARYNTAPAVVNGRVVADYASQGDTGSEQVVITRSSSPVALQGGLWYFSLAVFTPNRATEGTLTVSWFVSGSSAPVTTRVPIRLKQGFVADRP